jgi:EpsI family protein
MLHDARASSLSAPARMFIVASIMVAGALYLAHASRAEEVPPREPLAHLPMTIDGWTGRREPDFSKEILAILGVDDYTIRTYTKSGSPLVGFYTGYHESQRQGDTIHSPLNCLPGAGWQPIEQGRIMVSVAAAPGAPPAPIEINRVVIAKGLDRQLVYYWYQSHRRVVASEYWGKIYTVLDSVRYHRTDAAMVRIVVPVADHEQPADAERAATSFTQSVFPLLGRYLPT